MAVGDGLVTMVPTSYTFSGTSATQTAYGGIDFSAITNISLNGIFTSAYANYMIMMRTKATSGDTRLDGRLRAAGTDASGATDYLNVRYEAYGSSQAASRTTQSFATFGYNAINDINGTQIYIYGPQIAQATAMRSVTAGRYLEANIYDQGNIHILTTSYDGISLYPSGNSITGNLHVFAFEE